MAFSCCQDTGKPRAYAGARLCEVVLFPDVQVLVHVGDQHFRFLHRLAAEREGAAVHWSR